MSNPTQSRATRGYGQLRQYPSGNRYGHIDRHLGGSTTRRENIPPSRLENISTNRESSHPLSKHNFCAEPPHWLDSYLQDFKKKLISEITDDIMKALDASYKNDTDKRRFKASYFALKRRLNNLEAERSIENSEHKKTETKLSTSHVQEGENKFGVKMTYENINQPHMDISTQNGSSTRSDQVIPLSSLSSNPANDVDVDSSASSVCRYADGNEKKCIEESLDEHLENENVEPTQFAEEETLPDAIENVVDINEGSLKTIIGEKQDEPEFPRKHESSPNPTDYIENDKYTTTESTQPLREIVKLINNDRLDEESSTTTDHTTVVGGEIGRFLCQTFPSMPNGVTVESFEVFRTKVEDLKIDTPEKQREVIDFCVERARHGTMHSVACALACKMIALKYECFSTFKEMLDKQCDVELFNCDETEKKEVKELNDGETEKKEVKELNDGEELQETRVEPDQTNSSAFEGILMFMNELYNQDLLTDSTIEKYLHCFLENRTEVGLYHLCRALQIVGKNLISHERNITPYLNHLIESRESKEIGTTLMELINTVVVSMRNEREPSVPDDSSDVTDFEKATDE